MGPSDKPIFIIGSALAALLLIVGFQNLLHIQDKHHKGQPADGYALPTETGGEDQAAAPAAADAAATEEASAGAAPAAAGTTGDGGIEALIATADVAKGKKLFRRCGSCHSSKKGDPPALGPNLYGIIDRDIASQSEFSGYSDAMKAKEGAWTIAELSAFIANPKKAIPGTRMIFQGVKNDAKRANLLAYIKTLSD